LTQSDLHPLPLVNDGCELLTARLASLRETIVVGVNTCGVGQFVQPGCSVLPRTGLPYGIALGKSDLYGNDRWFDRYGLDVDLILPNVNFAQLDELRELAATVLRI